LRIYFFFLPNLFFVGPDSVIEFQEDLRSTTHNQTITLYDPKTKNILRPRFHGEEPWLVIFWLNSKQSYRQEKYAEDKLQQLQLKFRTISSCCLAISLIVLRQGDLNARYIPGDPDRPNRRPRTAQDSRLESDSEDDWDPKVAATPLNEDELVRERLGSNLTQRDIYEFACSFWLGYSLAGFGEKSLANSGHVKVDHVNKKYSKYISDFVRFSNYGNEGLNSMIKKLQTTMKPGQTMVLESLQRKARLDEYEKEDGMGVYNRMCSKCKTFGHRKDSRDCPLHWIHLELRDMVSYLLHQIFKIEDETHQFFPSITPEELMKNGRVSFNNWTTLVSSRYIPYFITCGVDMPLPQVLPPPHSYSRRELYLLFRFFFFSKNSLIRPKTFYFKIKKKKTESW
jgi:hypothetical protein